MRHVLVRRSAALAIALAGCGAESDAAKASPGSADRIDACGLATTAAVSAILGGEIADAKARFDEHAYTKPTTYSASCIYTGSAGAVMVVVHYPILGPATSSSDLASRVTRQLRSQDESDSTIAELYRTTEVRAVDGFPVPAAEYEMAGTATLEAHVGNRSLRVSAGSPDAARRVARAVIERLG